MPSEGHLVGQLLLKLAEEGDKPGSARESGFRNRLLPKIQEIDWAPVPYPIKTRNLPYWLGRSRVHFFGEKGPRTYIPLKPVVHGDLILPYLSVVANETLSEFRLLLLTFTEESQNGEVGSVGFRFESPEGDGGKHNYWHVQLTSSFEQNLGQRHASTPSWLPSNTPAIPLDASSAATCVVALAVALYGSLEAAALVRRLEPDISHRTIEDLMSEVSALSASTGDPE